MDTFWDFFWFTVSLFFLMAYLIVMFQIVVDLFRNHETNGLMKAVWVFFLIVVPVITALVYLVVHGQAMAERSQAVARESQQRAEDYVRSVAGTPISPTEEIEKAKGLLDSGAISEDEFAQIKARALG